MTFPLSFSRNGHRKFIAFVLVTSLAITGFSAAPARANDDVGKILAGLALLGIVGAVVHDHNKDKKAHHPTDPKSHPHPKPKPMPHHVRRYDLPGGCLTTVRTRGVDRKILPQRCLKRNYEYTQSLPRACYMELSNAHQSRRGFEPRCLRQYGYRLRRG